MNPELHDIEAWPSRKPRTSLPRKENNDEYPYAVMENQHEAHAD